MTPEKALIRLNSFLEANRFDEALAFVSSVEEQQAADSGVIHCMRGSVYDSQGNVRLAEGEYRKAVCYLDSRLHREALCRHAYALERLGETQEALQQAQRLVRIYPEYVEGHSLFGQLLHDGGRYDEAIPHLESGHKADSCDRRVLWALIRSYYFAGFLYEGRSILRQVLGSKEDDWDYLEALAHSLCDSDRYEAALEVFCLLLERRPQDSTVVMKLIYAANELNELEKVELTAKSIIRQGDRPDAAVLALAEVALERDRKDVARELLNELLSRTGADNWPVQSFAARVALQEGNYQDAYRIASDVLKHHDDVDFMRTISGSAACQMEMYREAVELFRSYLQRNEPESWFMYYLGCSEAMLGNYFDACSAFEFCIKEDPQNFESRRYYAVVLHQLGRLEEAKQHYEQCLVHDSDDRESMYYLMFLLDEIGDKDGSKKIADYLVGSGYDTDRQDFRDLVQQNQWPY